MTANERQVDGTHYKKLAVQPWDFIHGNGIGFLDGCAIKYLSRWRQKGGVADLRKAIHFIEKLIEVEEAHYAQEAQAGAVIEMLEPEIVRRAAERMP